jgi:hypothetical protein
VPNQVFSSEPLQHANGKGELDVDLSQINTNKCVPGNLLLHDDHGILTRLGSCNKNIPNMNLQTISEGANDNQSGGMLNKHLPSPL